MSPSTVERINAIAERLPGMQPSILTEEGTKAALIMPFISQVLGYDVFDPAEVTPEYVADVGSRRGEKIDYAIRKDGQIQLLVECKKLSEPLCIDHASQLFRYFAVTTSARIAILTNGRVYQVFTDIERQNVMDDKPFMVLDILDVDRALVPEVEKLSKESFDVDSIVSAAQELKYVGEIKGLIASEFKEPSDELVKFVISRVDGGSATQRKIEQFRNLMTKASSQFIVDQVRDRLKSALDRETPVGPASAADGSIEEKSGGDAIVTTPEELDGFCIVRAILAKDVDPSRVVLRDARSYFAILLDNNNRRPLVRLHLDGKSVKFITTFENGTRGERHEISSVVDLYQHADRLLSTLGNYAALPGEPEAAVTAE